MQDGCKIFYYVKVLLQTFFFKEVRVGERGGRK
jgi:hypothetical protein